MRSRVTGVGLSNAKETPVCGQMADDRFPSAIFNDVPGLHFVPAPATLTKIALDAE